MCGIAGIVGRANLRLLKAMADAIAHRGPDGSGLWHDEDAEAALAHRRLAIIDLSDAAAQPMVGVEGRYQVVFNGEIYNYRELGVSLRARGYRFNPNSDTAILAPLYDLFGAQMVERLNGIFAFAIWDSQTRTLFLARDHVGAKPLYYTRQPGRFAFASEIKALAAIPDLDRSLDEAAIYDYLEKLWCPGEGTPFRAVRKLPPSHTMLVQNGKVDITAWAPVIGSLPRAPTDVASAKSTLLELLDTAVSDQCLSDVPIGAFLSGGVDSTAIVASMVKTGHIPTRTYCIAFEGTGTQDEDFGQDLRYAKMAADALGVPLTPMWMTTPKVEDFARLAWVLDEPQADPAPLFVETISAQARADGVKVLLSGTGGDDIFSGYRRHVAASMRSRAGALRAAFNLIPNFHRSSTLGRRLGLLKELMNGDDESFLARCFAFNAPQLALGCLTPSARAAVTAQPNAFWAQALAERPNDPLTARVIRLERYGFLPDHNLNYTDKASMAHGVEVRVPLLDPRLIAFADSLPLNWKVHGLEPKWLLKRSLETRVPRPILTRSKTGFGGPVRSWINGHLSPALRDLISSGSFRSRGIFDPAGVERARVATASGAADGSYLLLAVMMVEFWLDQFASGTRQTAA
jgi:asparagine synthase (glutamine-hydrolysing)